MFPAARRGGYRGQTGLSCRKGSRQRRPAGIGALAHMEGLDPVVEWHLLEGKLKAGGPFREVLTNGDTATPGVRSLDDHFKRLLEDGER